MRFSSFSSIASFSTTLRASSSRSRLLPPPTQRQIALNRYSPSFLRASSDVSLHNLKPNAGSTKERRRVGRGVGSKMGGHTTGRGHKGQKSRSGKRLPYVGFEGGQLPLYRRIPKKGNANPMKRSYAPLNIARLQEWIRQGRIDPTQPITVRTVVKSNLIHGLGKHSGVKLLGVVNPDLEMPKVDIRLNKFSEQAGASIIQSGGSCTAVYHNRLSMEQELRPHKFIGREVTPARPVRRADIIYYTDPAKFGYLAGQKEQLFLDRGFDPTAKRSRIAGQPYRDNRNLTPEQAAAADAALAKKRMDEVLEIEKMRI